MIYLDNAATSFPKPRSCVREMRRALRAPLGNPGRGGHRAALEAAQLVYRARCMTADFFDLADPARVVFCQNTTAALNTVLWGLLGAGKEEKSRVLVSVLEHNSVLRPLYELRRRGAVTLDFFVPCEDEEVCLARFCAALRPNTRLACVTCRSNVSGLAPPVFSLCRAAHKNRTLFLADAAQAAGFDDISMRRDGIDYLCAPAHKGLYGVTGLGILLVSPRAPLPKPLLYGGAGFAGERRQMPPLLPERLEAGTLPVHAIAALCGGLTFLRQEGRESIVRREQRHSARLFEGAEDAGCHLHSVRDAPMVTLTHPRFAPEELAEKLDRARIAARAGLHCAPLAHAALGTLESGALRLSVGAFTSRRQIERTLKVLRQILR